MKLDAKKLIEENVMADLNKGLPHLKSEIRKLKFIHKAGGKMDFDMSTISDEAKIQIYEHLKKYSK